MAWQFWRRKKPEQIDSCATIEAVLSLYGDGMASPTEIRQVEAHLAECDNCRRSLEWIEATRLVIAKRPAVEPPANLRLRIAQAIAEAEHAKTPLRIPRRPLLLRPAYMAGAVAASVLIVGYFVANHVAVPDIGPSTVNGPRSVPPVSVGSPSISDNQVARAIKPKPVVPSTNSESRSKPQALVAKTTAPRLAHIVSVKPHHTMLADRSGAATSASATAIVHPAPSVAVTRPHVQVAAGLKPPTHRAIISPAPHVLTQEARGPEPSQTPIAIQPAAAPSPTIEAHNTPPPAQAPTVAPQPKVMVAAVPPRPQIHDDGLNSVRAHLAAFQSGSRDIKVALRKGTRFAASEGSQFVMLPAVYSPTAASKSGADTHE